ncbi:MAG: rhodanese-like domain-containing protein [Candidatus Muiribacteriota bacterium]
MFEIIIFILISFLLLFYILRWSTNRNVECISIAESYQIFLDEDAFFIDVRTEEEYKNGSIKQSINIPIEKIKDRIGEIPEDKTIITFCHSGHRAYEAYNIFRNKGFEVYVLDANIYDIIDFYSSI